MVLTRLGNRNREGAKAGVMPKDAYTIQENNVRNYGEQSHAAIMKRVRLMLHKMLAQHEEGTNQRLNQ